MSHSPSNFPPNAPPPGPLAPGHFPAGPIGPELRRAERAAGLVGAIGLGICVVIWLLVGFHYHAFAGQFYRAWLFAWMFWLGVTLGSMAVVMLHHLTGGQWGLLVRRFSEAGAMVVPVMFILGIPFLVGMRDLYPWADPSNHDAVVQHKRAIFFPAFFLARYCAYFLIWFTLAFLLRRLSLRHDRLPTEETAHRLRVVSALGLVLYVLSMSLASVDWLMSLEPHWYSTVFGFIICAGQSISGSCIAIVMLALLWRTPPFAGRARPNHFNDLGNLLMTCVVMWAYCSFSQLLVTWMGNLQSEIGWYVQRSSNVWHVLAGLLIFFGFLTPFVLLLMRGIKKQPHYMLLLCCGLLLMRVLDDYWMVAPSGAWPFPHGNWLNGVASLAALAGIGGMWVAAFMWLLAGHPLMPLGQTVPIETLTSEQVTAETRITEHGEHPGIQPRLA
ncbi:MAG TPA: hypothetical protein VFC78_00725 [Tepidisphaeraceae bacterium]|nr:hypothetical protein [Tepidisphaeraceae bacterium]